MTLATILNEVCDEVGIGRPSQYFGSNDGTARQLIALAQTEGNDLLRRTRWESAIREATHTVLGIEDQGAIATIAPGFRSFINRTQWNRTKQWPLEGPDTPQNWQNRQATVNASVFDAFRLRGGRLLIFDPTAGESVAFEYNSNYFCEDEDGTDQTAWAADTDVPLLDPFLFKLGVKWRFLKAKGLDYGEEFSTYEAALKDAIAQDGAAPVLNMGDEPEYAPGIGIPDGNWSVP